ncbi:MAG: DUF4258 domain-containing protein [Rhizobiales bacterium]|jgi:hypothetical protein|nr:DUF4258 domain-containing protein [Hyphomicrobiales bacterium]
MSEHRLIFTRHAELMLAERGIERAWVERTVNEPETIESDPVRDDIYRAFRAIPERNGRVLRVVYATSGEQIRIITAFFDRTRRR